MSRECGQGLTDAAEGTLPPEGLVAQGSLAGCRVIGHNDRRGRGCAMSLSNVLGVLDDRAEPMWSAFTAAVELADVEHARLTLTKTCDGDRLYTWFYPCAAAFLWAPPAVDHRAEAGRVLDQAVRLVPQSIPPTSVTLTPDTQISLRTLLRSGRYDAFVGTGRLLSRCPKVVRELRALGIRTVTVDGPTSSRVAAPSSTRKLFKAHASA